MKYAKDSPEFRMFQEYWSLIQTFNEVKTDKDVAEIQKTFESWVLQLPKEVQYFGLCLSCAYCKKCKDHDLLIEKGILNPNYEFYRDEDGHIVWKGTKNE